MTPSRCRIVASYDNGLSGWRCLSAGCGSWGLVKNGVLHESGTGKTLPVEFMTGPHKGVEGEQCRFDRSGEAFNGNVASAKPAPAPPAPANSELESLRKTVELLEDRVRALEFSVRKLQTWGNRY